MTHLTSNDIPIEYHIVFDYLDEQYVVTIIVYKELVGSHISFDWKIKVLRKNTTEGPCYPDITASLFNKIQDVVLSHNNKILKLLE